MTFIVLAILLLIFTLLMAILCFAFEILEKTEENLEISRRIYKKLAIGKAGVIEFYAVIGGHLQKVEHMFLKVSQKLPLKVAFKDAQGNLAGVEGSPLWSLTDDSMGALLVDADGMGAVFTPSGPLGAVKVQVKADADLGEGVKTIIGELDLDLVAGDAVTVEISAGTPIDL